MEEILRIPLAGLTTYLATRAYMRIVLRFLPRRRHASVSLLGKALTIDRKDMEQVYLELDCVREPENIFIYRALSQAKLCSTFVDVGANFGHVALKIHEYFDRLLLVDANPSAAAFLSSLFADAPYVEVANCALVDDPAQRSVTLMVPEGSSGLAHLSSSTGAFRRTDERAFECTARTLDDLVTAAHVDSAYIKVDVEGFESRVLRGGSNCIRRDNVIVGFEALSHAVAEECCSLFDRHQFYCGRFDFLNSSGALTQSMFGVARSVVLGGNISILRFRNMREVPLDNFSQIVAVPLALTAQFETALRSQLAHMGGRLNLGRL